MLSSFILALAHHNYYYLNLCALWDRIMKIKDNVIFRYAIT